jgi:putative ABC transport system substrate-binding protein
VKRREFISLLSGVAAWPIAAHAQQAAMPVIGFLDERSPDALGLRMRAFHQGLRETGFVEGDNVSILYRFAENRSDRLAALTSDLVHREVGVIATQHISVLNASTESDIDNAFGVLAQRRGALIVSTDPFFVSRLHQIVVLAAYHKIPAIYDRREFVAAGGLISYGTHLLDAYRQIGVYAGRIIAGAKPSDLPVMQPTKFELVINLKTAKALGLTIPDKLIALADEVIE